MINNYWKMKNLLKEEIKVRIHSLKNLLKGHGLEIAFIFSPVNLFYFTGTFARGFLLLTKDEAKLFVNRPFNRAKEESLVSCEFITGLKKIPEILKDYLPKLNSIVIGIETEGLRVSEYKRLEMLFENYTIKPIDDLIWKIRTIKSPFEIDCIIKAGKILDQALKRAYTHFKPGLKEVELSSFIERELRKLGHPGITRSLNGFELGYGYLVSGKEGVSGTPYFTGEGGKGVPGFPGGASFKEVDENEPILIDFGGYCQGYYIDQTRMLSFKRLTFAEDVFYVSLKILDVLEKKLKPGVPAEEAYYIAYEIASLHGIEKYFMNYDGELKFIGHGVGLHIDEPPVLGINKKTVLEENMVIALEPKFHVPEIGVIGIEETYLITKDGLKALNSTSRKWKILKI